MQIARFLLGDRVRWGAVEGDDVYRISGDRYRDPQPGRRLCSLQEVKLLAPLERTNKVVGIAANYGKTAGRDGPGIFMKQPTTVVAHMEPVIYPRTGKHIAHEAELGIVMGKTGRKVPVDDALEYVLGYTCVNDVSALELTTNDQGVGTSVRWKHFDTFCPVGPTIVTGIDGDDVTVECRVNGKVDYRFKTSEMLWGVAQLVSWVTEVMTLYPGDVISSGCPDVGEINPRDMVEVEIEGIGILANPVVGDVE